jgi:hypothetical protein
MLLHPIAAGLAAALVCTELGPAFPALVDHLPAAHGRLAPPRTADGRTVTGKPLRSG